MSLRFVDESRIYPIQIEDITFNLKSMSIIEKERLARQLADMDGDRPDAFKSLIEQLCMAIVSIEGFDEDPATILERLENPTDLRKIVQAIVDHCSLSMDESENSDSSSG